MIPLLNRGGIDEGFRSRGGSAADDAVAAVIPGTGDPGHMTDNAGAMRGPLPDPDQRRRMIGFIESL